ncbi:hypothetical protein ACO0QE_002930 [Hanseniaspora vineae]
MGGFSSQRKLKEEAIKIIPPIFTKIHLLVSQLDKPEEQLDPEAAENVKGHLTTMMYQSINLLRDISVMYDEGNLKKLHWTKDKFEENKNMVKLLIEKRGYYDDGFILGIFVGVLCVHEEFHIFVSQEIFQQLEPMQSSTDTATNGNAKILDSGVFDAIEFLQNVHTDVTYEEIRTYKPPKYSEIFIANMRVCAALKIEDTTFLLQNADNIWFLDWCILNHFDEFAKPVENGTEQMNTQFHLYFKFKMVKRAIEFPRVFSVSTFQNIIWLEYANLIKNENLIISKNHSSTDSCHKDIYLWLDTLLEIIDHSNEIDFFDLSDHLITILNASVKCLNEYVLSKNVIDIHYVLNHDLQSTLTFPAILNIVTYFLLKQLLQNNYYVNNDENNEHPDVLELLQFDKQMIPSIPPICKSMFQFDYNDIELPSESKNIKSQYGKVIGCLISCQTLLLNVLDVYKKTFGIDIFQNDIQSPLGEASSNKIAPASIYYKECELFSKNFFIPLMASLLLLDHFKSYSYEIELLYCNNETSLKLWGNLIFGNVLELVSNVIGFDQPTPQSKTRDLSAKISTSAVTLYSFIKFSKELCMETTQLHKPLLQVLDAILTPENYREFVRDNALIKNELLELLESCFYGSDNRVVLKIYEMLSVNAPTSTSERDVNLEHFLTKLLHDETDLIKIAELFEEAKRSKQVNGNAYSRAMSGAYLNHTKNQDNYPAYSYNTDSQSRKSSIVDSGKKYILGGHHRLVNTSRVQSVHIDDYYQ